MPAKAGIHDFAGMTTGPGINASFSGFLEKLDTVLKTKNSKKMPDLQSVAGRAICPLWTP